MVWKRKRHNNSEKNKLNAYPVFVSVWILIFSKDFVRIGDGYMKSAMNLLNFLLRKENPWLYRTFLKYLGWCY